MFFQFQSWSEQFRISKSSTTKKYTYIGDANVSNFEKSSDGQNLTRTSGEKNFKFLKFQKERSCPNWYLKCGVPHCRNFIVNELFIQTTELSVSLATVLNFFVCVWKRSGKKQLVRRLNRSNFLPNKKIKVNFCQRSLLQSRILRTNRTLFFFDTFD